MSSIRTNSGVSPNWPADEPSSRAASRPAHNHSGPGEIVDFSAAKARAGNPNESFELRDMVSLAGTYFERGMIDDAEEMVQEAISAGYSRTDALDLNRRIQAVRHQDALARSAAESTEPVQTPTEVVLDEFTRPLPGADAQAPNVRRAIDDSEIDIDAGRLHSALDATTYAISQSPAYLPLYVRMAELRMALGDAEGAEALIGTLNDALDAFGSDSDWLTLSMRVTLNPDDTNALILLARSLLDHRGTIQLEPYVPNAIEQALVSRPDLSLDLATEYVRLRPTSDDAHRLHLRSIVANGNDEDIRHVLSRDVRPDSSADLLFLRSAIAHGESREAWIQWLERCVARILADSGDFAEMPRAIDAARTMLPAPQHGLATAIVSIAGNQPSGALSVLTGWEGIPGRQTSDAREMLVAACARAFAMRRVSPVDSIEALARAVGQAVVIDVRPFAENCKLFARSISAESLMRELVEVVRETGQHEMAIAHLEALRDRLPEHLEIRTGLADLQVAAGRAAEGVRELRYIAEKYEQAGNIDRMVDAMRHISAAVPNNAEMKAKLIEGYIQRGVPEEAMRELRLLGDLHLKRGRKGDAAKAYTRGAEIAATTGSFRRAMDLFDRAIAADPDNVGVRHAAVAFYIMTGDVEAATEQLREIVRIALDEQDPDEAVAALHQIIGLAPADSAAYHKLGEVLTALGEYSQAERVYRRLAAFTPDDPVLVAKQSALAALASGQ